jgi:hypothetical protein
MPGVAACTHAYGGIAVAGLSIGLSYILTVIAAGCVLGRADPRLSAITSL